MNRIHVVVVPAQNGEQDKDLERCTSTTLKPDALLEDKKYDGWIPANYLVGQVKRDVARYWHLKASKYDLYDTHGNRLADEERVEFPNLHPATLKLQKVKVPPKADRKLVVSKVQSDPFWIHDQLFDLFLFYALQNRHGNSLRITSYQFKHLLQKATAKTVFQRKLKLAFDKRAALAFRGALSKVRGRTKAMGGLNFDEFLDALVDVACFMDPRAPSKEDALEKIATQHVIPYHIAEQSVGNSSTFSWTQMDVLMGRDKASQIIQSFSKSICYLATAYSSNVDVAHRRCVLRYDEFHRFVHDVIPKTVSLTPGDLCKLFIHCCRKQRALRDSEYQPPKEMTSRPDASIKIPVTQSSPNTLVVPGCGEMMLTFQCDKMMEGLAYIAFLAIPRLVRAKEAVVDNFADFRPNGKFAAQSIKALLHHISNHLRAKSSYRAKSNVEFSRARVRFLVEFNKMHREDSLADYQGGCVGFLQERSPQQLRSSGGSAKNLLDTNQDDTDPAKVLKTDFDTEFEWDLASTDGGESDSSVDSPVSRASSHLVDAQALKAHREYERSQLREVCNEADEIYAFLAGELQRHALANRWHESDTVPQMLDIWVAAGEKYSQVITHVEKMPDLRATFLSRFGRSLYVFAVQVLKSATKVYKYEELFYITNARAYSVESDLWQNDPALFTLDLAMETLSLASGKLAQASEELSSLVTSAKVNDLENSSSDEAEDSSTSTDGGDSDTDEEVTTASAYYEKYLSCIFHRANCLTAYADVLAHGKKVDVDYELGYCFEEENKHGGPLGQQQRQSNEHSSTEDRFFTSSIVLSKTSSPGEFYWGAKKMFRFLIRCSKCGPNFTRSRIFHNLAMAQFKLATHLPRGCVAEKQLLEDSLRNLSACEQEPLPMEVSVLRAKRDYIRAIVAVRQKFFLAERLELVTDEAKRDSRSEQAEKLTPFYRFVLAAAFREFDQEDTGVLGQTELTLLSKECARGKVCTDSMMWLLNSFESQEEGLTERGFLQYFAWVAEAGTVSKTRAALLDDHWS